MLRLETLLLLPGLFLCHTLTLQILLLILFATLLFLLFFTTHLKIIMRSRPSNPNATPSRICKYDEIMANAIMAL